MKTFTYAVLIAGLMALASAVGGTWGCGSGGSSGGGGGSTTNLGGTVAFNDGTVGTLTVTIQSTVATNSRFSFIREAEAQSSTVSASCTCVTPTCTITGTGTYTPSTGALDLSGTGGTAGSGGSSSGCSSSTTTTFTGTVTPSSGGSGGGMSGSISTAPTSGGTPTPVGGFSGGFTTPSGSGVTSYCGIAVGGDTDAINTTVAADGTLTGTAQPINPTSTDSKSVNFSGKVSGGTFTACSDDPNGPKPICGTISADGTINGRFQRGSGEADGCFVGNPSVCTSGTLPPPCSGATAVCTYPTCP